MHTMNDVKLYDFPQHGDERGHLVVVEGGERYVGGGTTQQYAGDIPFEIKRIFYIYGSDGNVVRGQHANRRTSFILINVSGTSKVKIRDGEGNEAIYVLNRPHIGIYLPTMIWKEMYDFSQDSVLMVLASEHYDDSEYIRDYDAFVKEVSQNPQ